MRCDVSGVEHAPKSVTDFLVRLGGRNPYGEPNFRIVLAQSRVCQQAAEWHDWDDSLSVQERGGFVSNDEGEMVASMCRPDRVVKEMRTIQRYPICDCLEGVLIDKEKGYVVDAGDCLECGGVKGWIIEKWAPVHMIAGSEEAWYAQKVEGTDLPRLGPYPHNGEYVRVPKSRATKQIPSLAQIEQLLLFLEYCKSQSAVSRDEYIRQRTEALAAEKERYRVERKRQNKQLLMENVDPLHGSSLAAGRAREAVAQKLRARGHQIGHVGA